MPITTIYDLYEYFPTSSDGPINNTPCPFCPPDPEVIYHRGRAFYGDNRLVWFDDAVWCRKCHTRMTYTELAKEFDPASELVVEELPRDKRAKIPTPIGVTQAFIEQMHRQVQRDYWYAFGWTDETIDHFRLGYGPVQPGSLKGDRHLIPYHAQSFNFDGTVWMMEGRATDPAVIEAHGKNIKTYAKGNMFSHIAEGVSRSIVVCEGAKDMVTLYQLGYRHILMLPGTSMWSDELGDYLKNEGYERVEIFGDNDDAGLDLAQEIGTHYRDSLIETVYLQWPSKYPDGFDVTDLLIHEGPDKAAAILSQGLKTAPVRGYIRDYLTIDPNYLPDVPARAKSVHQIREELPTIIDAYLHNYQQLRKTYKQPVVKVLASPPGSGKSYQMVRAAQDIARRYLEEPLAEQAELLERIENETDPALLGVFNEELSRLRLGEIVLYAGPFRAGWNDIVNQPCYDPDMWYFFDSRNEENCQNFDIARILGGKGYSVQSYCKTACPFRDACIENGYLRQFNEIQTKPIAYVRHQHLLDEELVGRYKVIMIDENPLKVYEQGERVHATDLRPAIDTWAEYALPDEAAALEELVLMLRRILNDSMSEYVSYTGREFFDRLNSVSGGRLDDVLRRISLDSAERFQPQMPLLVDGVKPNGLPGRKVPALIKIILEEYPKYKAGLRFNSRLSIVNRSIEFYNLTRPRISRNKPIIIADGTAWPDLYGHLFQRKVEKYDPLVYSDLAKTIVLTGKDYTVSAFRKSAKYLKTKEELEPIPEDDPANQIDETDFQSQEVQSIYNLIKWLENEHERVLFITTKERKELVEDQLVKNYPDLNVAFDHYGNVRGSNAYKDHDCIVVWGAYREPSTSVYRRVQAWAAYIGEEGFISPRMTYKAKPYHGRWDGHSYFTFENEFADRFIEMVEEGEMRQALDRIRPHTSDTHKWVYVVMSRPCAPWVSDLKFSTDTFKWMKTTMDQDLMKAISDYYWKHGKTPSVRNIKKSFRRGTDASINALKVWQEEQSSELDEKATELLTTLLTVCDDPIKIGMTYGEFGLDWRFTVAISEAIHAGVTTATEGLPTGDH